MPIQLPYIPGSDELRPFAAEIFLTIGMIGALLAPMFTKKANAASAWVALLAVAAALLAVLTMGNTVSAEHFRGMLVSDGLAIFWKIILLSFTLLIILMWLDTTGKQMREGDGPEFFTLLLGAALGLSLMGSTGNLLMIFLAVELASLPSYVLAGFRKTSRVGAEAAMKYVLFGAATVSIMVWGMSILYGLFGSLSVSRIAELLAQHGPGSGGAAALLAAAMLTMLVGIGFKICAVPLHFWCPDVFEGAGIDVAAFLSVASKGAGLILLFRLVTTVASAMGYLPQQPLPAMAACIGIVGAITCTVGNTAAYTQNNIKRLLAYSSVAHAGYMLCALSLLCSRGEANPSLTGVAAQALLLYLAIYMVMNLGAFTCAAIVERQGGGVMLANYAGLTRRAPLVAICMAGCLFSLVGLPPLAGFAAKLNLMLVLGNNGGWWWWLVVVIGVNTIFSLYYYARVVRAMFLRTSNEPAFSPSGLGAAISVLCLAMLVVLLIGFNPLLKLTGDYGQLFVGVTR